MKAISANQVFGSVNAPFAIQPQTSTDECQLKISVDGITFTDFDEAFTGTKCFKDIPNGLVMKCSVAIYFTH